MVCGDFQFVFVSFCTRNVCRFLLTNKPVNQGTGCEYNLLDNGNKKVHRKNITISSHLQSGAGHQRVSGSAARKRLSWYSSNRSSRALSSRIARTSSGASVSGHCGHAMPTLLSEISMRRYWRRQSEHVRWEQEVSRGKRQSG